MRRRLRDDVARHNVLLRVLSRIHMRIQVGLRRRVHGKRVCYLRRRVLLAERPVHRVSNLCKALVGVCDYFRHLRVLPHLHRI
jgi:hypothetical protein